MSPKAVKQIEAGVVVVGAAALLIWVPQHWFFELAMGMLVVSVLVVAALKKYLDRLEKKARSLGSKGRHEEATVLRVRRVLLLDVAMVFALVAFTAFIALVVVYAD